MRRDGMNGVLSPQLRLEVRERIAAGQTHGPSQPVSARLDFISLGENQNTSGPAGWSSPTSQSGCCRPSPHRH